MSHGSLTMEKVAVERGRVVGVEDWACCTVAGDPLRDLGRLAVSSAGSRVDRLLRDRRAVVSALRAGVKQGLRCLGLDPRLCPDVLILTLAEQAGGADQGRRRAGLDALQSYLATTKG
jgi:hypothetical protein